MSPRRLVPLLAVAVAGLSALGCAEQSAAIRVGDRTVSDTEMVDELDAYGENEALFAGGGSTDVLQGELRGSYVRERFVTDLVQRRIQFLLTEQVFEDRDLTLTDADRSSAQQGLAQQLGPALDALPDGYRAELVDDTARVEVLITDLGTEALAEISDEELEELGVDPGQRQAVMRDEMAVQQVGNERYRLALVEAARSTDIAVSSHYGHWDEDNFTVTPPDGPGPAGGGTELPGAPSELDAG